MQKRLTYRHLQSDNMAAEEIVGMTDRAGQIKTFLTLRFTLNIYYPKSLLDSCIINTPTPFYLEFIKVKIL